MTLRKKIYLIVALTFLSLTVILAVSSYNILIKGIQDIEGEDVRNNLEGALFLLNQELAALDVTAHDYASWDDMYAFVKTRNRSFITSNFVSATLSNLKINFIVITDRDGNIVHAMGFDPNIFKTGPIFKSILDHRKAIHDQVFSGGDTKQLSGILYLPEGFTLLAAQPILNSYGRGNPRGLFIIGRFLDNKAIRKLGAPLKSELSLYHQGQTNLPVEVSSVWATLSPHHRELIKPINGHVIAGHALIKDVYGKYSLLVRTLDKRNIFGQGMSTIIYVIAFVIFTALVFTMVMVAVLEKSVLRGILHISNDVKAIETDGNMSRRIHLNGKDEIAKLGNDINNMLEKLEISERKIRSEAEKYRAVIEDQTEFICRFGENGILSFVNDAYYRFFSHRRRAMIGRHFLSFIPDEDCRQIYALLALLTPNSATTAYETRVIFPEGQEVWQHWTYRAIYDNNGGLIEYQAVGRDITDRKQAEEKLSNLNRQLEEANVQLGQAYAKMKYNLDLLRKHLFKEEFAFLVDREGRICGITERVIEYMKLSRNQIIDANMTDYLPAPDRQKFVEALHNAWIGITRQANIKLILPEEEATSQLFEIKFARLTLEGKRMLLVTLR